MPSDSNVLDIAAAEQSVAAALAKLKPPAISETDLIQRITTLCAAGRHDAACHFMIANIGGLLQTSLNPKEKMNNLYFLSHLIQGGGSNKHGPEKLRRKFGGLEKQIGQYDLPAGGGFMELGCGAHDPLALSVYYFLNGFDPCYGVDLLEPRNAVFSAFSMYLTLSNVACFPERYLRKGSNLATLRERLALFDIAAFEAGDFWGGFARVADKVKFIGKDIAKSEIAPESLSLVSSFAVLEHVSDIAGVCATLYGVMKPRGILYHFVDMADHRAYRGVQPLNVFHFLTEESAPANMNRLRAPEIVKAHLNAGFEVLAEHRTTEEMPEPILRALQPKFRAMSVEDLSATKLVLTLRRPG